MIRADSEPVVLSRVAPCKSSADPLAKILRMAVLALLACAVALPAAAQVPSSAIGAGASRRGRYTISGTVRLADGQLPLESVQVQLWTGATGMASYTFTNSNGNFAFENVRLGTYYLVVQVQGYERIREEVNFSNHPSVGIQLMLQPEVRYLGEKIGTGPTVSTREMAVPRRAREAMERGLELMNEEADYEGSVEQFQRAAREYADYYEAYMQMGLAYMRMGDMAKSEEMLLTSITMSARQYPEALSNLAFLYSSQDRFADAEPLAREAVALDPNSWDANEELAQALHGLKRETDAEAAALQAMRLQPANPQTYLLLANIHMKAQNYTALARDLDSYLQLEPDGPQADQARRMLDLLFQGMANIQPREQ